MLECRSCGKVISREEHNTYEGNCFECHYGAGARGVEANNGENGPMVPCKACGKAISREEHELYNQMCSECSFKRIVRRQDTSTKQARTAGKNSLGTFLGKIAYKAREIRPKERVKEYFALNMVPAVRPIHWTWFTAYALAVFGSFLVGLYYYQNLQYEGFAYYQWGGCLQGLTALLYLRFGVGPTTAKEPTLFGKEEPGKRWLAIFFNMIVWIAIALALAYNIQRTVASNLIMWNPACGYDPIDFVSAVGAVTAAATEELFSRGLLMTPFLVLARKRKWYHKILLYAAAIAISSAEWSLAHQSYWDDTELLFDIFLFGIMYGALYAASKKIWVPFMLHLAWNFILSWNVFFCFLT